MRIAVIVLAMVCVLTASTSVDAQGPAQRTADVIVLFRPGVAPVERERLVRQSGATAMRHFRNVPASVARADARSRAFLERDPDVLSVVPDRWSRSSVSRRVTPQLRRRRSCLRV